MPDCGPLKNSREKRTSMPLFLMLCLFLGSGCRSTNPSHDRFSVSSSRATIESVQDEASPAIGVVNFDDYESVDGERTAEKADQEDSEPEDSSSENESEEDTAEDNEDDSKLSDFPNSTNDQIQQAAPANIADQLDTLIATALAMHPRIAAARQAVAAAASRIPQVRALPDPMVGNTFWPIHDQALQTAGGRVGHQFSLSQNVPWPTKLDAKASVAAREVQVAQVEIAKAEREIVESVRLAYYDLWLADELIRIIDDNKELVTDLITISEARYKAGGSQQDVLRAELEGDRLEAKMIELRRQKEQARADLGALVRQPIDLMPVAVVHLDVSEAAPRLDQLVASAEQYNPILRGLAAEIDRDRAKETLACTQKYPDLQLGLGYSIINDNRNVISPVANGHDNLNLSLIHI